MKIENMTDVEKWLELTHGVEPIIEPHVISTVEDGFVCGCDVCSPPDYADSRPE
jgi:hypothetical protein